VFNRVNPAISVLEEGEGGNQSVHHTHRDRSAKKPFLRKGAMDILEREGSSKKKKADTKATL